MKKLALVSLLAVLVAAPSFAGILNSDEPGELIVSGQYVLPGDGDFDTFDNAFGATLTYREWFSFPWGVGLNVGVSSWQANDKAKCYKCDAFSDFDGSALVIPVGLSLYFNLIDWDNWNLVLGTGFQYLFVESDIDFYNADEGIRQDLDIGNAILWNVGADYEYMLTENAYILGGVGYQVDAMRADTDYPDDDLRDTSFRGFFGRLGVKFLF